MARGDELLDPRVQVMVRPPSDPEAAGHAELQAIGSGEDEEGMEAWSRRPWLVQDAPARGAELETLGLSLYAGHPELSLVNVPTAFVESGVRLLKELGTYVLAGGVLEDGDVMQLRHDLPYLVGVRALSPAEVEEGAGDVLRVVMLA